ncbi:LAFA_0E05380g1_1 [Lachancea sp. 'fantastica']|nr:LAFA_0E05380g1_1 [Lachancea sp. 'fantastica']
MAPKSAKLPVASHAKEQQNVTIEDLLFPRTTIANLAKDSVLLGSQKDGAQEKDGDDQDEQKKVVLSKDAVTALQRAATVFVNYLMVMSREGASFQNRKSCNVDDVLAALDHCGLEGLSALVRERLDEYNKALELRKLDKQQQDVQTEPETKPDDEVQDTQDDSELPDPAAVPTTKKPKVDG